MSQAGSANSSSSKYRARNRRARMTCRTDSSETGGASPAAGSGFSAGSAAGPVDSRASVAAIRLISSRQLAQPGVAGIPRDVIGPLGSALGPAASMASAAARSAGVASISNWTPDRGSAPRTDRSAIEGRRDDRRGIVRRRLPLQPDRSAGRPERRVTVQFEPRAAGGGCRSIRPMPGPSRPAPNGIRQPRLPRCPSARAVGRRDDQRSGWRSGIFAEVRGIWKKARIHRPPPLRRIEPSRRLLIRKRSNVSRYFLRNGSGPIRDANG